MKPNHHFAGPGAMGRRLTVAAGLSLLAALPALAQAFPASVEGGQIRIQVDQQLHTQVIARFAGRDVPLGPYAASEWLEGTTTAWKDFQADQQKEEAVNDAFGPGKCLVVSGTQGAVRKTVSITLYEAFPAMAMFRVTYLNQGREALAIKGWTNHAYTLAAKPAAKGPTYWAYLSGSYERRPDWVKPLRAGFHQENFLGMNAPDYGGGTPIVDVWSREVGLAIGHFETMPLAVSLPVALPKGRGAQLALRMRHAQTLPPGVEIRTLGTFVSVHQGDYFHTLTEYRRLMARQGFKMAESPDSAFGPIWCAWGYGRTVQPGQIYKTLPTVKKLGFTWVTMDDGWQDNYADWRVDPKKFPRGDADMKALVDRLHADGFLAQLWWAPLMGSPSGTLAEEHPEYALLNRDGSKQKISYWPTHYLCPAAPGVVEYSKALVRKMIGEWGYDGLKLDGQYMNQVPPCYNPAHHHQHPEDSVTALPGYFKEIYETALSLKPKALVEFCPCGTAYSFFTMPHYNMSVGSDPSSSFQVRSKGKTLKGLMGDGVAYFGDHVELSDGANDFASTVGVGGVIGTQFVLPSLVAKRSTSDLTPSREKAMEKWLGIYTRNMLPKGRYLGELYDMGFDRPEGHAIQKGESLFFGFYAKSWKGPVELRGLAKRTYRLVDYEHQQSLGQVTGPTAVIYIPFKGHLLIEASPE